MSESGTFVGGDIYICGTAHCGRETQPVHTAAIDKENDISFPTRIIFPKSAHGLKFVSVAADAGVFAALDTKGGLWGWGGHCGAHPVQLTEDVKCCDVGANFIAAISNKNELLLFGNPFAHCAFSLDPTKLETPFSSPPVSLTACNEALLVCVADGTVWCIGKGIVTGLGHDATKFEQLQLPPTKFVALGSVCAAAITLDGGLYVWGDGLSGTLGLGKRTIAPTPTKVESFTKQKLVVVHASCTRGQPGFKRNGTAKSMVSGQEGPRIHAVTEDGGLWIAGTTHKGLGGNHMHKVMQPDEDQLDFYRVGGAAADAKSPLVVPTGAAEDLRDPNLAAVAAERMGMSDPSQFGAGGNTNYLTNVRIVHSQPLHIHSVAVSSDGKLFTWGCGSDGRTGLRAFLRGPGGSKRRLKCYISTPSVVEELEKSKVLFATGGRYWTLAIVA